MPVTIQPAPTVTVVTGSTPPLPVGSPGVVEYVSTSYPALNSAANTVTTYANGRMILPNANLNFVDSPSLNVRATANGYTQANVSFDVNVAAISGGNSYEADVLANGHLVIANANSNYNNTATLNVLVTANGTTQANIAFNVNVQAVVANTEANVTNAVNLVYATNPNWYALYSGAN